MHGDGADSTTDSTTDSSGGGGGPDGELDERERAMLDFERITWSTPGRRDQEIRSRFDMTPYRYHQVLRRLLGRRAALAYAPVVVNRLRRVMESRAQQS